MCENHKQYFQWAYIFKQVCLKICQTCNESREITCKPVDYENCAHFVTFLSLTLALVSLQLLLLFSQFVDVVRGSDVTTIDVGRLCGAANAGALGNELDTGRQTQANIFFVVFIVVVFQLKAS